MQEHKKPLPWFGIVLIVFGILLISREYYRIDIDNIFELWPLVFVFWGINKYRVNPFERVLPTVLICIGVYFLLDNFGVLPYFIEDNFWAFAFILFGIYLIFQNKDSFDVPAGISEHNFLNITNIFGGSKHLVDGDDFKGGHIFSAFGGPEIDLRGARIKEGEAVIHVTIMFGGVDFLLPEDWRLVTSVVPIFGGTDDSRRFQATVEQDNKTLIIKGIILFGGIEIR